MIKQTIAGLVMIMSSSAPQLCDVRTWKYVSDELHFGDRQNSRTVTKSPASAGIANRALVFWGIFFNFRTRMTKLGVQVANGCHFHVVKTK